MSLRFKKISLKTFGPHWVVPTHNAHVDPILRVALLLVLLLRYAISLLTTFTPS
jgi:hypothetical protein